MDNAAAEAFAAEWIAAWNAHDLERILGHYAPDIVFRSPLAAKRVGDGCVVGLNALRRYWGAGLATQSDLRFELSAVLTGYDSLTILYANHRSQQVAETCEIGADGKVVRAYACYAPRPDIN